MFQMLVSLVPNLTPHYIHCDFEQAVINAVRECFPEATFKECFFYLVQCFSTGGPWPSGRPWACFQWPTEHKSKRKKYETCIITSS